MELTRAPWSEVSPLLDKGFASVVSKKTAKSTSGKLVEPSCIEGIRKPVSTYLRKRGYDPVELENTWGLGMTGPLSSIPWRVYIPIYMHGDVVSWTTRSIQNEGLRYISAKPKQEVVNHKNVLYGADLAKSCIIVVEGPADVWRIGPGAVGTFGLNTSHHQIQEIASFPSVCICFDSGGQARDRANTLAKAVRDEGGVVPSIVTLESGSDPGEADLEEIQELREKYLE
jgi:DNA primase